MDYAYVSFLQPANPFNDNIAIKLLIFEKDPHADWKYGAKYSTRIMHIPHIQGISHSYMSVLLII